MVRVPQREHEFRVAIKTKGKSANIGIETHPCKQPQKGKPNDYILCHEACACMYVCITVCVYYTLVSIPEEYFLKINIQTRR